MSIENTQELTNPKDTIIKKVLNKVPRRVKLGLAAFGIAVGAGTSKVAKAEPLSSFQSDKPGKPTQIVTEDRDEQKGRILDWSLGKPVVSPAQAPSTPKPVGEEAGAPDVVSKAIPTPIDPQSGKISARVVSELGVSEENQEKQTLTLEAIQTVVLLDGKVLFEEKPHADLATPYFDQVRGSIEDALKLASDYVSENHIQITGNKVAAVVPGSETKNSEGQSSVTPMPPIFGTRSVPVLISALGMGMYVKDGKVYPYGNGEIEDVMKITGGDDPRLNGLYVLPKEDSLWVVSLNDGTVYAKGTPNYDLTNNRASMSWKAEESGSAPWEEYNMTEGEYKARISALLGAFPNFPKEIVNNEIKGEDWKFNPNTYAYEMEDSKSGTTYRFRPGMGTARGKDGTYHDDDLKKGKVVETSRFTGKGLTIIYEGSNSGKQYTQVGYDPKILASPEAMNAYETTILKNLPELNGAVFYVQILPDDVSRSTINRSEGVKPELVNAFYGGNSLISKDVYFIRISAYHNQNFNDQCYLATLYELISITRKGDPKDRVVDIYRDVINNVVDALGIKVKSPYDYHPLVKPAKK